MCQPWGGGLSGFSEVDVLRRKSRAFLTRIRGRMASTLNVTVRVDGLPPFRFATHAVRDSYISTTIRGGGLWEPNETHVLRRMLRPGDFVIDIGANIGWHTVIAALAVGPSGRVIAFEPGAANASVLRKNVLANQLCQVDVRQAAVSDHDGVGRLYLSPSNLGDHRLDAPESGRDTETVEVCALASVLTAEGRAPALIKIDAQGSESRILGAIDAARLNSTAILVEFWPHGLQRAGSNGAHLAQILAALGHHIYIIDHWSPGLKPTDPVELAARASSNLSPATDASVDLLCIPSGHPLPLL